MTDALSVPDYGMRCSFCGQERGEAGYLVNGPLASICGRCANHAKEITDNKNSENVRMK